MMLTNTSTHQNDMSNTTVDVQDGDDGVSELGVSDAASASGLGTSTSGTQGVVTIDVASMATAEESQRSRTTHIYQ
jgi:hypothetical protein